MATIKIDSRVYILTDTERDAYNTETTLQAAVNAGEITPEAAADLFKLWFIY